ncbi:MAG: dipeptidase [Xanthomonadaceae bacterium]|nr:dipeptidase [Xanthomonadaceae bacterium]
MSCRLSRLALSLVVFAAIAPAGYADEFDDAARRIAQTALIADTHIDAPYGLEVDGWLDLTQAVGREFDYPKARAGGLDLAWMSIYTPSGLEATGGNRAVADRLIDYMEALVGRAPDKFAIVRSPDEAEAAKAAGKVGLALGMENGSPIGDSLDGLRHFHARGVRYVTLAHALSNAISDASFDTNRQWGGLSPFGREVVAEMNRLGIFVDVSHLTDDAIRQVLAVSSAPVIASHSSARHFTPGFERNLSDELIKAIAAKGGVVHINFGSAFLTQAANAYFDASRAARTAWQAENPDADASALAAFEADYRAANPYPFATTADVADHIEHVIALAGIDHVGLGSDYDGVGDSLPTGLKTVADFPNLIAELLRRGHSQADIEKILGGNLLRAWREVERVARQ